MSSGNPNVAARGPSANGVNSCGKHCTGDNFAATGSGRSETPMMGSFHAESLNTVLRQCSGSRRVSRWSDQPNCGLIRRGGGTAIHDTLGLCNVSGRPFQAMGTSRSLSSKRHQR